MGTRNVTCVVLDDQIRVAQYAQWDGYISGQGVTIYEFIKRIVDAGQLPQFKEAVRQLKAISDDEVKAYWKKVGADNTGWVDMEISKKFQEKWMHLSRDCGAKILELIHEGKAREVYLDLDFPADSLFCEWAYVIDLDNELLEVYAGFQKEPHKRGRFADMKLHNYGKDTVQYYPVALIKTLSLLYLPETKEQFLELFPREDEGLEDEEVESSVTE